MARRSQSKQATTFEAVTGLAVPIAFLWFFSPGFRAAIQILLLCVVVLALIALAIWLLVKLLERVNQCFIFSPNAHHRLFIARLKNRKQPSPLP
jgi:hypothetical protein